MSIDSETHLEENSPEAHVEEVDSLLGDIGDIEGEVPDTPYGVEAERSTAYQQGNDWETQTAMTRGNTSITTDDTLSKPEQHALGARKMKEEYGLDVASVADVKIDGVGEIHSVTAEYSIELNFTEQEGLQYELERTDVNARNLEGQTDVQQDLEHLETQLQNVIQQYNTQPQQPTNTAWEYGQQKVQALDD